MLSGGCFSNCAEDSECTGSTLQGGKKMQLPRTVTHKLHYALLSQKKCALLRITIKYCQNSSCKYFFSISHDHNYCMNINCPHGWELAMDYWLVFTDKIENFHHLLWMTKMHAPGSHSKANSTYICMHTCSQMYYSLHAFFSFFVLQHFWQWIKCFLFPCQLLNALEIKEIHYCKKCYLPPWSRMCCCYGNCFRRSLCTARSSRTDRRFVSHRAIQSSFR